MIGALPELRGYQADAVQAARDAFAQGHRAVLLRGATGSGKTHVFCFIVAAATRKGRRTLVLAHRKELIDQASRRLDLNGIDHGVIMAGHWRVQPECPVQVASVQTLRRRLHLARGFDLIIPDEAHHTPASTYQDILAQSPTARILGPTATPFRSDGRGLGELYTAMVSISSLGELVEMGYLVRPRAFAPSEPELRGVHVRRGDYDVEELAERCDRSDLVGDIVEHWQRLAAGRATIAFAVNIRHSEHIAASFRAAGIAAEHLDGTTPADQRDAILARLASGATKIVCNVGVLTEGTDIPVVSCIICARPTRSMVLFIQTAGRGLRTFDGKTDCVLLDHAGLWHEHGSLLDEPEVDLQDGIRRRKKGDPALRMSTCLRCYAVYRTGPRACPNCGFAQPAPEPPKPAEGTLEEVPLDLIRDQRIREVAAAETIEDLRRIGAKRGYHPRWADHVWRHRSRSRAA